ncbi:MAG: methyltransferase domain-containing protein, partial [Phycisphaerales bacterium]|nr:methyltransferase domain-containing protein [Phycisphaerales bacterium]
MPEPRGKPARKPGPRSSPRKRPHHRDGAPHRRDPAQLGFNVRIVFEDDEVIVVDKPPGIVTALLPGEAGASADVPSVFGEVKRHARARKKGPARVWVVHRLDKEASGLLVFAKTERAFAWLKEDFRARRAHRLYLAVVENEFPENAASGTLQGFLAEDDRGLMRTVPGRTTIAGPRDFGPQLAVTHYRVLHQSRAKALVQVRLRTGRKNQIRVQMSEAGHPLVGDYRYRPRQERPGTAPSDPIKRLCLHATELGFAHPSRGETLRFRSPAPREFWTLVGAQPPAIEPASGAQSQDSDPWPEDNAEPASPSAAFPAAPSSISPGSISPAHASGPQDPALSTSWDHVARWYEELLDRGRSDHQRDVIVPGTLRLLQPRAGARILDVACGEGMLCRKLASLGVEAVGVDASPRLIDAARAASAAPPTPGAPRPRFEVGDARAIGALDLGTFDAAACIMALMNIDPVEPTLRGIAASLKPGGSFVAVILHPAFRAPGQTSWGWDESDDRRTSPPRHAPRPGPGFDRNHPTRPARAPDRLTRTPDRSTRNPPRSDARQYRRVDGYLSPGQSPIIMNPGHAAHGKAPITTWTFHRPLQFYFRALAEAGFVVNALEEWPSLRRSEPGPRANDEHRARRAIPLFLGLRAPRPATP